MGSIHDAIGDQREIDAAVHRFRDRVAADPDLACHFRGMDFGRIMAHEIALLRLFFNDRTIQRVEA